MGLDPYSKYQVFSDTRSELDFVGGSQGSSMIRITLPSTPTVGNVVSTSYVKLQHCRSGRLPSKANPLFPRWLVQSRFPRSFNRCTPPQISNPGNSLLLRNECRMGSEYCLLSPRWKTGIPVRQGISKIL